MGGFNSSESHHHLLKWSWCSNDSHATTGFYKEWNLLVYIYIYTQTWHFHYEYQYLVVSARWFIGFLLSKCRRIANALLLRISSIASRKHLGQLCFLLLHTGVVKATETHSTNSHRHQSSLKRNTGTNIQTVVLCHIRAFWTVAH